MRLWLQLQPHLGEAIKKTEALSGEPMVVSALRNDLIRYNMELDEALGELEELPISYTKE